MATIKPISVPSKRLSESISSAASSFKVSDILGWDGSALTSSDFGSIAYVVFRNDTNTLMELIEIDPTTIASSSITINKRGLQFDGNLTTEVSANKLTWVKNETIVEFGSNPPQLLEQMVKKIGAETIAGIKTFSSLPATSAGDPVDDNDLARKAYVDSVVAGSFPANRIVVSGTAGETVAAGDGVYLDTADNEWKKWDASASSTSEDVKLGIAQGAGTDGNAISNGVLLLGIDTNQSGMTEGEVQYVSDTAGEISSSVGTKEVEIGIAKSATELYFIPKFLKFLTEDQQDALAGSSGTPSSSNTYITEDDVSATSSASKIVRADASGKIHPSWLSFGGTGADGALDTSGGTVDIDLGAANVVVKNYTTINVATNSLTFSNPASGGTIIILKATGNVTISNTIDASGIGATGGTGGTGSGVDGGDGTDGISTMGTVIANKGLGGEDTQSSAGVGGAAISYQNSVYFKVYQAACGAGGGGGGSGGGAASTGGAGGRGGAAIIIECAGALDFSGTITAAGDVGLAGANGSVSGGGGGGGGAGGSILVLYNTLTANTGTLTVSGGAGGTFGSSGTGNDGGDGGGGGGHITAGTTGNNATNNSSGQGGAGGAGGNGQSLVVANTDF